MKKILILILGFLSVAGFAQNLVDNPSFENRSDCPIVLPNLGEIIPPWDTTGKAGPINYFNQDCGDPGSAATTNNATAFDGDGFMGMLLYGPTTGFARSYVHAELKEKLDSGTLYRCTFFVKPVLNDAAGAGFGINNISAAFTDSIFDSIPPGGYYNFPAQVKNENPVVNQTQWTPICGIFMSDGTEEYITIGNFASDNGTTAEALDGATNPQFAYYLVDYVSVIENNLPNLPQDTFVCREDRVDIDLRLPDINVLWQDGSSDNYYTITEPGTYYARISDNACSYFDTINVVVGNCDDCKVFVPTAFTPNGDGLNDIFKVTVGTACPDLLGYRLRIYDRWGKKAFESNDPRVNWNPQNDYPQGVYTYTLEWEYELFSDRQRSQKRGSFVLLE
jgi:gliding motility-associated-like protein